MIGTSPGNSPVTSPWHRSSGTGPVTGLWNRSPGPVRSPITGPWYRSGHWSILPVTGQYYRSHGTGHRSRRDIDIHHRIIHPLLLQRHLGRQLVPTIYVDVVHDLLYRVTLMHGVDLIDTGPPRL
ncbi:hypothetical protein DPMN_137415 [Dreissena polymorpha]|uniref:Uncharacterized protein n=1 Tax=Dreissena polymorpha TaxID=45954 RepID=A0A9D4G2Q2_DREPO|nr:hypothetical protein DPMN_137415 [Dreissena polymorpha]